MKLSEIFSSLLLAEDRAAEDINTAKKEAERLLTKTRSSFDNNRRESLDNAHAAARVVVENARQRGDNEALDILNAGKAERMKINELFEKNVDVIMASLANEVAEECVANVKRIVVS